MTRIFTVFVAMAALMISVTAQKSAERSTKSLAAPKCSASTLRGVYGHHFTGVFFISPSTPVPLASVGRTIFDGAGGITGNDTNSFGGTVASFELTGTYSVNEDCTGTMTVNESGFAISSNFVIVEEGKQILAVEINPGSVASGNLLRQ